MSGFSNLYRFELRQNRRSLLIWWVVLSAILIFFMAMFPSMSSSDISELVNAKLAAMPKSFSGVVGLNERANFQDVGYFFAYSFQFVSIALIVYAISLGSGLISKEHTEKHIDYLATKPVGKGALVRAKYAAALTLILLLTLLLAAVGVLCVRGFGNDGWRWVELGRLFGVSAVQYIFWGTAAMFASLGLPKTGASNMLVLGLFFVTYILGAVSKVLEKMSDLRYLSPYYMFETVTLSAGIDTAGMWYLVGLAVLSLLMIVVGVLHYQKKDLSL